MSLPPTADAAAPPAAHLPQMLRLGDSARDMMEPVCALVAAEAAWRVADPDLTISAEAVAAVVHAGEACVCS